VSDSLTTARSQYLRFAKIVATNMDHLRRNSQDAADAAATTAGALALSMSNTSSGESGGGGRGGHHSFQQQQQQQQNQRAVSRAAAGPLESGGGDAPPVQALSQALAELSHARENCLELEERLVKEKKQTQALQDQAAAERRKREGETAVRAVRKKKMGEGV
jgi:hypothetical protein